MGFSPSPNSSERLRELREALLVHGASGIGRGASIEAHGAPDAARASHARVPTQWAAIDAALGGGIPGAGLHEWWGEMHEARAVCVQLAWNALLADEAACPGAHRHVAWVGREAWPNGDELVRGLRAALAGMFGGTFRRQWPDARLHDRSLLIEVPAHDAGARLWAIEQAARCPGVCAVVADGRGFDLPATRRLQLAASSVLLLSLRGAATRRSVLSACSTRWHVLRAPDAAGIEERAPWLRAVEGVPAALAVRLPAEPSWLVTLERAKGASVHLSVECGARAARNFEWEGVERAPAPEAAAMLRRQRRADRLRADRVLRQREHEHRHPREHGHGHGQEHGHEHGHGGMQMREARGRGRDRMTSRGERWARAMHAPVHADASHGASRAG